MRFRLWGDLRLPRASDKPRTAARALIALLVLLSAGQYEGQVPVPLRRPDGEQLLPVRIQHHGCRRGQLVPLQIAAQQFGD